MTPKRHLWMVYLLIVLAGLVAAIYLETWLFTRFGMIEWGQQGRAWLKNHGLSAIAGYYSLMCPRIPKAVLAVLGGSITGLVGGNRWLRLVTLYILAYMASPYVLIHAYGMAKPLWQLYDNFGLSLVLRSALHNAVAIVPLAVFMAWVSSSPRARRAGARRAAGLCQKCGYKLTGNVSGVCPECGEAADAREC